MIGGNYAGTTAQIGLGALRRAAIPENQPNLGVTLAQSIKAYKDKQKADEDQRKYEAYQEALKSGDAEAIKNAQIDLDPEAYQKAMAEKEADELDFNRRVQLMDMQNRKSLELAAARDRITRQNAQAEMDRQNQVIDAALASGQITPEQAQLAKTKLALGNLVDFGGGDTPSNPYGLEGKALDTYNSETAKNIVKAEENYNTSKSIADTARGTVDRINEILDQDETIVGPMSGWSEKYNAYTGNNPEWLEKRGQVVTELTQAGNFLIKQANESGVTGINSLPEVERIIRGLTPSSSPAQIRGAIKQINRLADELEQKSLNALNRYKKGGDEVMDAEAYFNGGE